jgi:two-component system NtrC family sensor kinase
VDIAIADTGKGMSKEALEKIFDPFFTTKKVGEGTGLGLTISYSIIEKLGGHIHVTSKEGQGTTFHIALPIGA